MTTMQIRDASLYVKVVGNGYPLVLMHGGPGLDHTSLLPLQPCADRYTMVFYDQRCNGRSDGIEVTSMTWDNLTADAEALRQALGFEKWAVLGHSFGGMVALEYALRYPDRVSHLILMDTCGDARWVQDNAPQLLARRGFNAAAVEAARRFYNGQLTPAEFFPITMKFSSAYHYPHGPIKSLQLLVSNFHTKFRPEPQIFGFSQLYTGWNVMDRLSKIKVPTLVMAGRYDFLFPPESQAILADRIPGARLELIEHAGHNPPTEQTEECIEVIRRFMDGRE